jgi:lactate dehydrogenase-like 2-hydroxyacid dehydrogenase
VGTGCIGFELAKDWLGALGGEVIAFNPYSKDDEEFPTGRFRRVEELEGLLKMQTA